MINRIFDSAQLIQEVHEVAREVSYDDDFINNLIIKPSDSRLIVTPASTSSSISTDQRIENVLNINPLWTADWNAFPENLRINHSQDPRLEDRKFIQEISNFAADVQHLNHQTVSMMNVIALRFFLKLTEDPEKAKKAFRSMVAHELGHLYYQHSLKKARWERTTGKILLIANIVLPLISYLVYKVMQIVRTRKIEYMADRFAAEKLLDATEGAEYGFACAKASIKETRKSKGLTCFEKLVSKTLLIGNDVLHLRITHGSCDSRIKRMRKHQIMV